jgi:hypothetical protein
MSEFDEHLHAHETNLTGNWIVQNGRMAGDITCQRIEWLISHYLRKVADSPKVGAWETVYQDPSDGRYWERTYPQSEMHGGGPPRLHTLTNDEFKRRYGGG